MPVCSSWYVRSIVKTQETEADKFDRARLVEVLTAPYIEDSGGGIVALDPHALKKLFTTTIAMLRVSLSVQRSLP